MSTTAFNGKQTMPRNRNSQLHAVNSAISQLKAEMNPSIKTFRPSAQPSPIKTSVDGKWSYGRFRLTKLGTSNGGSVTITTGNVAEAIGLSKVDFQIDRLACWLMGSPDYQCAPLSWTPGVTLLPSTLTFTVSDYGTSQRPASIGVDLPRALTLLTAGATSSSTGGQFVLDYGGTGLTGGPVCMLVVDLWVLYRQSA